MKQRLMVLALVGLAGQAMAGGLFFSEYIEGSSNNKALEIYNATGATVDMSLVTVKAYNNGSLTPSSTFTGTGVLADGDVYVIGNPNSTGVDPAIVAASDAFSTVTYFNGDDAVELVFNGVSVDIIGVIGTDPGASWAIPGGGTTADRTLVRKFPVCEGSTDWAVCSTQWDVYPQNTVAYIGDHLSACGGGGENLPPVIGLPTVTPSPIPANAPATVSATITDDASVAGALVYYGTDPGLLEDFVTMSASGDVWSASLPGFAACTQIYYQIVATDDESSESSSLIFNYTVECVLTIAEIQGLVDESPFHGQTVITSGVVTAIATAGSGSFFIQDAAAVRSGIQVYGSTAVAVGDEVQVQGEVEEYFGQTEILLGTFQILSSGNPLPASLALSGASDLGEDHESVRVCIGMPLTCTSEVNNFGEALLTDGTGTLMTDDLFYDFEPTLGSCWNLCGIGYFGFGVYRLLPTGADDTVPCPVVDAREDLRFALGQAWPNPFNPVAQISFSLDRTAQARLSVFNVLGQEVAVLAEGLLAAGEHQVSFDATALPSGLYFYNLQHEGRQLTGKMTLVR